MTDYADLEKRLRACASLPSGSPIAPRYLVEAADALASLTRELEEAKDDYARRHKDAVDRWEALRAIFDVRGVDGNCDVEVLRHGQDMRASEQMRMIAARALGLSRAVPSTETERSE